MHGLLKEPEERAGGSVDDLLVVWGLHGVEGSNYGEDYAGCFWVGVGGGFGRVKGLVIFSLGSLGECMRLFWLWGIHSDAVWRGLMAMVCSRWG